MFRYLYFRFRYGQWFQNSDGIKKFSEQVMFWLIEEVTICADKLTRKNRTLETEKSQCHQRINSLQSNPLLSDADFHVIRSRVRTANTIVWFIVLVEVFLNYVSTLIFIDGEGLIFMLVRWGLAFVVTFTALFTTDKFLEDIWPVNAGEENKRKISRSIGLGLLLIGAEIAIAGITHKRAMDFEGGRGGILYIGFILLSCILPLIAGYFLWDKNRVKGIYENTKEYYGNKKRIDDIEVIIKNNEEKMSNYFKSRTVNRWSIVSEMQVYKSNYDEKASKSKEDYSSHYCLNEITWNRKAVDLYLQKLDELIAKTEVKLSKEQVN